ncbi:hypothetical protein [Candidatus Ulvibacter alkanivorans]|uniref:hypothetical protein n=1 Tax=Candidatus Ulvibacter alkanivorans TaxID=2267620 RepID=UPI00109C2233|nr:hypothetical protein [Candidatus Ulvibacter alkanivorans]
MDFIIHFFENANLIEIIGLSILLMISGFFSLAAITMSLSFGIYSFFRLFSVDKNKKKSRFNGSKPSSSFFNTTVASSSISNCSGSSGSDGCGGG